MATLIAMASADNNNIIKFRGTPEDYKILAALQERMGLKNSQILRFSLRRLYDSEFPKAKGGGKA